MKDIEQKVDHNESKELTPNLSQNFAVVDNPAEIQLVQIEMLNKFLDASNQKKATGKLSINKSLHCEVNVSGTETIWFLYNLHTDMGKRKDRYWNILGSGKYRHWKYAELELNIPKDGVDRSMQAAFVKDENGKRYLVHRGGFRGKKKMMKRRFFMERFNGNKISAGEGRKLQEFAVIASLDDNGEKFIQDVVDFLREVNRIKAEFNNLS